LVPSLTISNVNAHISLRIKSKDLREKDFLYLKCKFNNGKNDSIFSSQLTVPDVNCLAHFYSFIAVVFKLIWIIFGVFLVSYYANEIVVTLIVWKYHFVMQVLFNSVLLYYPAWHNNEFSTISGRWKPFEIPLSFS
jgi:hypothetical protein